MGSCLNCGTELLGPHCYRCGQKADPRILPLRVLIGDAFAEVFALDSRLLRTLRLLFRRPGFLTNEYIAGRRADYVPPLRLYLLVSVVYFLVLALTGFDTFFFVTASPGSIAARYMPMLPRLMFVILPAFALLLKIFYPRRMYVEHLVSSLHLHTITFVLLTVLTLIINLRHETPVWFQVITLLLVDATVPLAVFVYVFLTLRAVYGSGRLLTALKLVLLVIGYLGLLTLIGAAIINGSRLLQAFTS